MGFSRKGSPEKINAIKVTGNSTEQPTENLVCSKCGKKIGTRKGALTIISGKTTIGLNNSSILVCLECGSKGK